MQIHELPSAAPAAGQYIPVDDGTANYKIDYNALAAAIIAQAGLGTAATKDSANNLTTDTDGYVLDARQGKALKDEIDGFGDAKDTNVANNVTTAESGYVLDARQGKTLNESITAVRDALTTLSGNIGAAASKNVANNLTTTNSGYVLDARQGYALDNRLSPAESFIADLGTLAMTTKSLAANGSTTVTIPSNGRYVMIANATAATCKGMYIIAATSGGAVSVSNVLAASGLTVTTGTNAITVANSTGNGVNLAFIKTSGPRIE